ncbi:MAG TPA: hypothetical protein VNX40_12555 [Mucilaginibacter sp.]|nr:hypothetical protein [Mucilaginibacter sp.]
MKKLIKYIITTVTSGIFCFTVYAQSGTATDPTKNPGPVDLGKHPEVMAKVNENLRTGKIAYRPTGENSDTTLDLSKHPELVKALINNPANWPIILKAYDKSAAASTDLGRKRQVIRDIIAYLVREHIVKDRADITSFLLTDDEFIVNGQKLTEERNEFLKDKYIPEPGYKIYYGNEPMSGKGFFQRTDNL